MSPADPRGPRPVSARKRGRKVAGAIYYGLIGAVCVAATVQVSLQVFSQPAIPSPYASCHDGLRALVAAVERARGAAPGADGEDRALERFRGALEPAWRHFDGVAAACKGSEKDEGALDAIERLRYAEEHAVRREAGDLAPLRQRVQAIIDTDLAPTPAPAP
ncbi:hypothetical protein [Polyangium aurulentum]|uniref:hypothetical protein n=1 Tax=Polyangium aurulentum TaxID=2567896 RepID=UPI00197F24C6|nr:hypothetical protein [Polyangium aurulentum]UQA56547.1 hypothetical protein E8A73_035330 [Polyangium aurulentum]